MSLESDVDSAGILRVITPPQPQPHISREAASLQESLQLHYQALEQNDRLEHEGMEEQEITSGHTEPQQQLTYLPPVKQTYLLAKQKSSPQMARKAKQKSKEPKENQTAQAAALPTESNRNTRGRYTIGTNSARPPTVHIRGKKIPTI